MCIIQPKNNSMHTPNYNCNKTNFSIPLRDSVGQSQLSGISGPSAWICVNARDRSLCDFTTLWSGLKIVVGEEKMQELEGKRMSKHERKAQFCCETGDYEIRCRDFTVEFDSLKIQVRGKNFNVMESLKFLSVRGIQ
jgi:hypothetical protein